MADIPVKLPPEDPSRNRRAQVAADQSQSVTFAQRGLTIERLNALRDFLKSAKSDEIATIRKLYGDMPEVLRMIGLEMLPEND